MSARLPPVRVCFAQQCVPGTGLVRRPNGYDHTPSLWQYRRDIAAHEFRQRSASAISATLLSITLTNASGKTVSLLSAESGAGSYETEFIHLNGAASTLLTASVPDDTYTSASVTVGGASISCVAVNATDGSLTTSTFAYGQMPQANGTVNLAAPIAISGSAMSLSMQLEEAQSFTLAECPGGSLADTYAITPDFNLAVAKLSSSPATYLNGKENDVLGQVTEAGSGGFSIQVGSKFGSVGALPVQKITTSTATIFEGIDSLAALKIGKFVDMDLGAGGWIAGSDKGFCCRPECCQCDRWFFDGSRQLGAGHLSVWPADGGLGSGRAQQSIRCIKS